MQEENTTARIFSNNLRIAMASLSFTQIDVASRSCVTQAAVSKWLGGTIPKGDQLLSLSKALNVTMEWLLTGKGSPVPSPQPNSTRSRKAILKSLEAAEEAIARAKSGLEGE